MQGMQQNPLDQLKDIHLPDPISIWPLGMGWWVLVALIICFVALTAWWIKKNQWKRVAKQQLLSYEPVASVDYYYQINRSLKQIAVQRFGSQCAQLSGPRWLEFLDDQLKDPLFSREVPEFGEAPDNPNAKPDPESVQRIALLWLKKLR